MNKILLLFDHAYIMLICAYARGIHRIQQFQCSRGVIRCYLLQVSIICTLSRDILLICVLRIIIVVVHEGAGGGLHARVQHITAVHAR